MTRVVERHTSTHPIRCADEAAIQQAATVIQRGGLAAFPTETVYGLGADATNPQAVARVFEVKHRPRFDPLIVHVASPDEARTLWRACPDAARRLMDAFWPGPLTLVLPKTDRIPDLVTAGLSTVAVRMPDHAVAQQLIRFAACPIAAPSANWFGRPSPTTAQAVLDDLGDAVDLILDGGPTRVGIESTVVTFDGDTAVLLRPGGVPIESLTPLVGDLIRRSTASARPSSPGMLARHYAPRTPLYLLDAPSPGAHALESLKILEGRVGLLTLSPVPALDPFAHVEVLSQRGDLVEAAASFFEALRRLDAMGLDTIVASPVPEHGLGLALMDRLRRASSGTATIHQRTLVFAARPAHD